VPLLQRFLANFLACRVGRAFLRVDALAAGAVGHRGRRGRRGARRSGRRRGVSPLPGDSAGRGAPPEGAAVRAHDGLARGAGRQGGAGGRGQRGPRAGARRRRRRDALADQVGVPLGDRRLGRRDGRLAFELQARDVRWRVAAAVGAAGVRVQAAQRAAGVGRRRGGLDAALAPPDLGHRGVVRAGGARAGDRLRRRRRRLRERL